jgi:hypothetical protein
VTYWLGAWAAFFVCGPSISTSHTSLLFWSRTQDKVCELSYEEQNGYCWHELSYGEQNGYCWQIERLVLSLFVSAFIFNTSEHADRTTRHKSTVGRPRDTPTSYQPVSGSNKLGVACCWKVFGLVFVAVDTPRYSRTFRAECLYLERENAANWDAFGGPDSSAAPADVDCHSPSVRTYAMLMYVLPNCKQTQRWIEKLFECKWLNVN